MIMETRLTKKIFRPEGRYIHWKTIGFYMFEWEEKNAIKQKEIKQIDFKKAEEKEKESWKE